MMEAKKRSACRATFIGALALAVACATAPLLGQAPPPAPAPQQPVPAPRAAPAAMPPKPAATRATTTRPPTTAPTTRGAASAPVATEPSVALKPEGVEQLAAPIALYPDSLLAQVLMASTYPLEVVQADRWLKENAKLKDNPEALNKLTWDPAVKSLLDFPQVLTMMSEKLEWTV